MNFANHISKTALSKCKISNLSTTCISKNDVETVEILNDFIGCSQLEDLWLVETLVMSCRSMS